MQARLPDRQFLGLCGMAVEMGREARGEVAGADISDLQVVNIADAMAAVLVYACAKPRISLKPHGPDEIHLGQIPMEDAVFVIKWALRRARITLSEKAGCVSLSERPRHGAKGRPKRKQRVN